MASCLGLYIENNLIKYAKISKSNNVTKIDAFGFKFYENLESTIKQIVEETYSFKTPISINLSDEAYNQFQVFSLLSPKDIEGIVKTEFENTCYDNGVNKNAYEQRYILASLNNKAEKIKIIHVSAQKTSIEQRKNQLKKYRINGIYPIGITIPNLIGNSKETKIIVNIEKNTTITKVSGNTILDVNVLPYGSQEILEKIKQKENSYSKAYEICKNTTIYTEKDKDLQYEENMYLEDVMPTLFKIVSETRNIVNESLETVDKVYITGTMSAINNIDIYFQEYLKNTPCEILRPSFVNNNSKINIKDYIEVNSAISVALQQLEKNNINFTSEPTLEKVWNVLKTDISVGNKNSNSLSVFEFLDKYSRQYNIVVCSVALITFSYIFGMYLINKNLDKKIDLANDSIRKTTTQITSINEYSNGFSNQTQEYQKMIDNIESINNTNSENKKYRNIIPNLLNNIMAIIPKQVQLVSIENPVNKNITITAKSKKYEQIAFFKTKLKTEGILNNIVSDSGTMSNGYVTVTIEGELP